MKECINARNYTLYRILSDARCLYYENRKVKREVSRVCNVTPNTDLVAKGFVDEIGKKGDP